MSKANQAPYALRSKASNPTPQITKENNMPLDAEAPAEKYNTALNPEDPQYIALLNGITNLATIVNNMDKKHDSSNKIVDELQGRMTNFKDFAQNTDSSLQYIKQKQAVMPSISAIPSFSGTITENVTRFVTRLDQYASFSGLDDTGKTKLLPLALTSRAKIWYEAQPGETRNKWENITKAMKEKYGPQSIGMIEESKLLERKQGPSESVQSYSTDMFARLDLLDLTDTQKVKIYIRGLQPYYHFFTVMKEVNSLEEAEKLALQAESVRGIQKQEQYESSLEVQKLLALQTKAQPESSDLTSVKEAIQSLTSRFQSAQTKTQKSDLETMTEAIRSLESKISKHETEKPKSEMEELKCTMAALSQKIDSSGKPPFQKSCYNCGQNHLAKHCPLNTRTQRSAPICQNCHGDHHTNTCSIPPQQPLLICNYCGIPGHRYQDCRKRQQTFQMPRPRPPRPQQPGFQPRQPGFQSRTPFFPPRPTRHNGPQQQYHGNNHLNY